jgi:hypothetical protein
MIKYIISLVVCIISLCFIFEYLLDDFDDYGDINSCEEKFYYYDYDGMFYYDYLQCLNDIGHSSVKEFGKYYQDIVENWNRDINKKIEFYDF